MLFSKSCISWLAQILTWSLVVLHDYRRVYMQPDIVTRKNRMPPFFRLARMRRRKTSTRRRPALP